MDKAKTDNWGDYYYQSKRPVGKKAWILEAVHFINQSLPTFDELFDEVRSLAFQDRLRLPILLSVQETFYVFAFLVVLFAVIAAVFLSKVVGITIKEHNIEFNRDWGRPEPANPFRFPWKVKRE